MDTNRAAAYTSPVSRSPAAITVAILAMGGEGGGVLADWIVDLAEHASYFAQKTSVPGVAQRTGTTIYYCEIFPESAALGTGREPVLALMPVVGELDIVIASELMECGRAIQRGLVTPNRTTLIASTHRVYSITEKSSIGDGRVDATQFIEAGRKAARRFVRCDFATIAAETGSVISAPLFGALAATGALPFSRSQFEDAIRRGGVGVDSSLTAFAAGFAASDEGDGAPHESRAEGAAKPSIGATLRGLAARVEETFPAASHEILLAGILRLGDYQDVRYAADYLDKLDAIRNLDAELGSGDFELLRETARYLALWMSYEDAIRVADLKIRRARFERVQDEAGAGGDQLVHIREYLHPRLEEIADIMPASIGAWLLRPGFARRMIERLTRDGRLVETTSLAGFLQLYAISSLRPLRRRSLRFRREHTLIASWMTAIPPVAREDYALAREIAECPRLVKGYGETHHRGSQNFATVMGALPRLRGRPNASERLRRLREAALADDTGEKLEQALQEVA
jgi:indolepyruvate ferredoxin oxidoreductase, beta subunit